MPRAATARVGLILGKAAAARAEVQRASPEAVWARVHAVGKLQVAAARTWEEVAGSAKVEATEVRMEGSWSWSASTP